MQQLNLLDACDVPFVHGEPLLVWNERLAGTAWHGPHPGRFQNTGTPTATFRDPKGYLCCGEIGPGSLRVARR